MTGLKKIGGLVVALILAVLGLARCATARYQIYPTELSGFTATRLALSFAGADNRLPWVIARIQDQEFRLMLDSGHFEALSLAPEALARVAVSAWGKQAVYRDTEGRAYHARSYVIPSVNIR